MPGRTYANAGAKYKYGFNGKENDNEVKGEGNQQDYGMRIYDPRLGRFLSVDPLTSKFPWYTPYQFAGNKPIIAIDLDGLEDYIVINYYNRNKEPERTSIITLTNRASKRLVDMQMRAAMKNGRLGSLEAQGKRVLVRHVFSDDDRMFASERRDILIQNETYVLNNGQKLHTGGEDPFQIEINEGGKMVSERDDYKSSQFNLEERTVSYYERKIIRPNETYTFKPFDVIADIIEVLPSGKKQAEKFAASLKKSGIKEVTIQPVVVLTSTENILRNGKTLQETVTANYKLLGTIIEKISGVKVTVLPTKKGEGNSNLQIQTK
ncbi:MAG: hypothetical protein H3C64_15365, partial [Candidatus Kuenenia stuttgartiensis]|nr:hypothetical protein [Candidatus Kuenenia stuttgartiensis]